MNVLRSRYILLFATALALACSACQTTRNFTTYYNLFYNMERIMDEVEEELLFMREQKSPEPVYFVPFDDLERRDGKFYAHLERRSMNNEEMINNKRKLDSILIKGSKLMARNAKSDYVSDAVYYIGKTYFYEREWYQSQKKCEELINGFPTSRWYADAHLVESMDLMWQGKIADAQTMISRTIDVAWARERKDILIDAFRLNADLQLGEGNVAEALKPYYRAMTLSTDDEDRARWQYEIGMIHFRRGDFQAALAALDSVGETYSPDVLMAFQTGMQRAAALRALGQYDDATRQLDKLRHNGNYEDWYGLVELEMLNLASARPDGTPITDADLARIDSISPGKAYSAYSVYEHSVRAFRSGDFRTALEGFNKVKAANVPFNRRAGRYASQLDRYFEQTGKGFGLTAGYDPRTYPDSAKAPVSDAFYATARVFAALDMPDSLQRYYNLSYQWAAPGSPEGARVLYAWSTSARAADRSVAADSLLDIIVDKYPLTEYAVDARKRLGYTEASVVDSAADHYQSGILRMNVGEFRAAMQEFLRVIEGFPKSQYVARAYYAMGLIYEQRLDMLDSAYSYYGMLVDRFPRSEQAISVAPLLQAVNTSRMRRPSAPEVTPTSNDAGEGSGVNMDWMKENPPAAPEDDDQLVPLNGDTSKLRRPSKPSTAPQTGTATSGRAPTLAPADTTKGAPASGTKPPVTKPPTTKSPVTKSPTTKPPVTKPPTTKPPVTKPPATTPVGGTPPNVPPGNGTPPPKDPDPPKDPPTKPRAIQP